MHTVMIEFNINENTLENLDTEKEGPELNSLIAIVLKMADLGIWSRSAVRGHLLIISCTVEDETLALKTRTTALAGHDFISFLV